MTWFTRKKLSYYLRIFMAYKERENHICPRTKHFQTFLYKNKLDRENVYLALVAGLPQLTYDNIYINNITSSLS